MHVRLACEDSLYNLKWNASQLRTLSRWSALYNSVHVCFGTAQLLNTSNSFMQSVSVHWQNFVQSYSSFATKLWQQKTLQAHGRALYQHQTPKQSSLQPLVRITDLHSQIPAGHSIHFYLQLNFFSFHTRNSSTVQAKNNYFKVQQVWVVALQKFNSTATELQVYNFLPWSYQKSAPNSLDTAIWYIPIRNIPWKIGMARGIS